MDSFKSLYLEYCKTYNVEPQECVKVELKRLSFIADESSYEFNLSSHHLNDKNCMILSKIFARDQKFTALNLNDCSLSNDALRDICHAMITNNSIKFLELKGNNIHGSGTEHIAKMIRQNSSLISISLEWNSIGIMDLNSFQQFCESLSINKSLRDLDLRNNQINHSGALELSSAIEVNTTLKNLDLRWNNIGLVGGKAILSALKKNQTLQTLQLSGNNIPDDICDAINNKIVHNNEQAKIATEYSNRTNVLSNQLKSVQFQKDKQVNLLLSKIDLQEENVRRTNRTMNEKMKKLQNALEDRMSTMSSMTSKLAIAEADLALAEQKCADLNLALQKNQLEKDNEHKIQNAKNLKEKEEFISEKLKLEREINNLNYQNIQLVEKLKENERKCQELQITTFEAKEKLVQIQAEYQIKTTILDDESRRLKQKHKEELNECELNKQKEIERLKDDFEITEKSLRDRINKLESIKHSNEDEIGRLKTTITNDKLFYDHQMHEINLKFRTEDAQRHKDLDDRIRQLQTAKDDLISENGLVKAKIVDQQQKITSQTFEIEALKRNNDLLRSQLNEKDLEMLHQCEKMKTDNEKRLRTIQKDIEKSDSYKAQVHDLEIKIKKMEADYEISLKNTVMEKEQLKSKLKSLEETVEKYREEDNSKNRKAQAMINEFFKPSSVLNKC